MSHFLASVLLLCYNNFEEFGANAFHNFFHCCFRSTMANERNMIERFSNIFQSKNQADDSDDRMNDEEDLNRLAGHVTQGSDDADFEYLERNRTSKRYVPSV